MILDGFKQKVRSRLPRPNLKKRLEDRQITAVYASNLQAATIQRDADTRMAVVVHLYYTESWPLLAKKLQALEGFAFDLFITLPESNKSYIDTIRRHYPRAYCIVVPNRGRDVLPFIMVAKELQRQGYEYLLKMHSKKSTHRTDGLEWLSDMATNLLPSDKAVMKQLMSTLEMSDTGVVGPAGQYMPLTVNFEANGVHMTRIVNRTYSKEVSYGVLQEHRADYGFFAGTMFWLRLDAVAPILQGRLSARHFEREAGQIDGTIAHALERLFCVVPEIAQKKLYEVSTAAVTPLPYDAGVVPDWSDVYTGPRSDKA